MIPATPNIRPLLSIGERLVALELQANDYKYFRADVESRLRSLEKTVWCASGLVAALELALKYVL